MVRRRRVRAGFISLLAGGALALSSLSAPVAGATPSSAARTPSWHVVYKQAGLNLEGVTAGSPDSAWAYGVGPKDGGKLLHWNGRSWTQVRYPDQNTYDIFSAFVLSPTDVWFAGSNETPPDYTAQILHLRNGKWSWLQTPSQTNGADVDVLADNSIWAADGQVPGCPGGGPNLDTQGCTPTSRWNGSTWHSYPLPVVAWGSFASTSPTDVWATGESYLKSRSHNLGPTFVQYVFRWTGSGWKRSAVAGVRSGWTTSLVVDAPTDAWLTEPSRAAPRACAVRWDGKAWRPLHLPGSRSMCRDAVTDYRTGFWTVLGGGEFRGRVIVGFAFLHWTGTRYTLTPTFVPSKKGWNTDGFSIAAVPHSSRVWVYGSWCPVSRTCPISGVIATLR